MKGGEIMKKSIPFAALILAVAGSAMILTTPVSAADPTYESTLVQNIAKTFGLNKDKVEEVFRKHADEKKALMKANYETRLNQLVKDGKITDAQKKLIMTKHNEIMAKMETEMKSMQGKTAEEQKAAMEAKRSQRETNRQQMQAWASENGIDIKYLMMFQGHGFKRGMK